MGRKQRTRRGGYSLPYILGEGHLFPQEPRRYRNTAYKNARKSRYRPTRAERQLELTLINLNHGILKGRFIREFTVANKWNLDFFFPENRLAIEVDGSIHRRPDQRRRDTEKEQACVEWDITLIRLTNQEVFGNRESLVRKLREGWRQAKKRNKSSRFALQTDTFGRPTSQ